MPLSTILLALKPISVSELTTVLGPSLVKLVKQIDLVKLLHNFNCKKSHLFSQFLLIP